jgi:hypothetical protein
MAYRQGVDEIIFILVDNYLNKMNLAPLKKCASDNET